MNAEEVLLLLHSIPTLYTSESDKPFASKANGLSD
jgi:hypothetical protein